jgi:hypothetical protein
MGCGTPKLERSQHWVPSKQLSGLSVQPWTWHWWVTATSQNVASVPAQPVLSWQDCPAPIGGRRQNGVAPDLSQAYPPVQSPELLHPVLVQ